MPDNSNPYLERIEALENKLNSMALYIAAKERGNEAQAKPTALKAILAIEDKYGTDIHWMRRFVGRYKDAFYEGEARKLGL